MFKLSDHQKKVVDFIWKNTRYVFVVLIFVLAIFYNQIAEIEEIKKNKKIDYQTAWKKEKADLDDENLEKAYIEILNSTAGDYYRLGIKIGSVKAEKLHFIITTLLGEEKEIGSMDILGDDAEKYQEFIFFTDKNYKNLKIKKEKKEDNTRKDGNVFINHLHLSRLDTKNEFGIENLIPTVFGDTQIKNIYTEEYKNLPELKNKKYLAGAAFSPEGDYINEVAVNLSKVGGVSLKEESYQLELHYFDAEANKIKNDAIQKVVFTADEIVGRMREDGNCYFELPVKLKKDKKYFIGISRKNDGSDNIKISDLENSEIQSRFMVSFVDFARDGKGKNTLTNARVEDLGNSLIYQYSNNHNYYDLLDVFEYGGKLKFNKSKKVVVNNAKKGNFFIYKISTVYPIKRMRVSAIQSGNKEKQLELSYSYDNKFWKKLDYDQEKDKPQKYDQTISDSSGSSEIYLKISYAGEKNSNDVFGLDKLEISAELER